MKITIIYKGGPGSGNWGHDGRPGLVGGSKPGGGHERLVSVAGYDPLNVSATTKISALQGAAKVIKLKRKRYERETLAAIKQMGFDYKRVRFSYSADEFEVDGHKFIPGGTYNPDTGLITIHPGGISSMDHVSKRIIAHEMMHRVFDVVKTTAKENAHERNREADKYPGDKIDEFMYANGRLKKPADQQRFALAQWWDDEIGFRMEELMSLGGVSAYSKAYWDQLSGDRAEGSVSTARIIKAINETLSEVAAIEQVNHGAYLRINAEWRAIYKDVLKFYKQVTNG